VKVPERSVSGVVEVPVDVSLRPKFPLALVLALLAIVGLAVAGFALLR
jgi:hypothetical protein